VLFERNARGEIGLFFLSQQNNVVERYPLMKALPVSGYVAVVLGLLFLASVGQAQTPAYQLNDLGTVGGTTSHAFGINDLGQVVGDSLTAANAATDGAFFDVDLNGAVNRIDMGNVSGVASHAYGINNLGQIVGAAQRGALFFVDGTAPIPIDFGHPTVLQGINDSGRAVGTISSDANDTAAFTCTFTLDGTESNLVEFMPSFERYQALAVNRNGQIAGIYQHAIFDNITPLAALYTVAGGFVAYRTNAQAFAISNAGVLAGEHVSHAATFVQNGGDLVPTDLGTLGGSSAVAYGINSSGEVVGNSETLNDTALDGFVYTPGDTMRDLNALVGASPAATSIQLSANGNHINEWGQIAAVGTVGGNVHALRLDPNSPLTTTTGLTRDCKIVSRLGYGQVPSFADGIARTATIVRFLDGTVGNNGASTFGLNRDVNEQFVGNPSSVTTIASDAVSLTGTGNDTIVVQMNFSATQATALFGNPANARLCCYQKEGWTHLAVESNKSGTAVFAGNTAYDSTRDFHLGRYGVYADAPSNTYLVWAVVNHTGTFGAAMDPVTLSTLKSYTRPGTTATLKIDGYTGYTYQLQKTTSLTGTWATVGQVLSGSTGTLLTFTNADSSAGPAFYRVLLGP
jgi:probable HAF family extracellular repeat protein